MTGATEGVCRPLQSRVEQILASETSPVTLYRTTNLIRSVQEWSGSSGLLLQQPACHVTKIITPLLPGSTPPPCPAW